ncbi:MAG TPA: glycosyltransferase [Burkholderiales bacterium]|nr:glycosyltransferase [Burkholderiales bacterium]
MKRIVLTTFGSYGDLYPYIAVARGLLARGHLAVIATTALYRDKVEQAGVGFHATRPDLADLGDPAEITRRVYEPKRGAEYITRQLIMPHLPRTFDDLLSVARGADLLVSHALTYTAPLIARKLDLPWLSTILSPMVFMSTYDPPLLPPAPWLKRLYGLSPALYRLVFRAMRASVRSWSDPLRQLARERGLPEPKDDPLFEGQFSPFGTLAMFSPVIADPQPDWPPQTQITGFLFLHDADDMSAPSRQRLDDFLAAGDAPLVFTLGSSAVFDARDFYAQAVEIARRLDRRAVLLTGKDAGNNGLEALPSTILAVDYAPHSIVFPRAAAIVHQGGIGTLAQALKAGRPMLVVPFSHDQPDNAERAQRLGVARCIPRAKFSVERAVEALQALLDDARHAQSAQAVAEAIRAEDGVRAACDRIERLL